MAVRVQTEEFVAELKRWRDVRGLSQSALALKVGYTPSYISKVESQQQRPSREFAELADEHLRAAWCAPTGVRSLRGQAAKRRNAAAPSSCRAAAHEPGRGARGHIAVLRRQHLPRHATATVVQLGHGPDHQLPDPDLRRPLPGESGAVQRALPRASAHLGRDQPRCEHRRAEHRLACAARPGRVQGAVAAVRERGRPLSAVPRRVRLAGVQLHSQ